MIAREQRYDARVAAIGGAHEELRTLIAISQQAALTVKRELERFMAELARPEGRAHGRVPSADGAIPAGRRVYTSARRLQVRRVRERVPRVAGRDPGAAGELPAVLRRRVGRARRRVRARRVPRSAEGARRLGAAGWISITRWSKSAARAGSTSPKRTSSPTSNGLPDGSLGGLFAAQVVEHLQPAYLLRFLEVAYHKLRPGAPIVLETLNPACWTAFFDSFIRDITHVWPLHPETLRYLVLASGFSSARIEFRSPVAPQDRLQPVAVHDESPAADLAETFNANVEKLNARMFSFLDYAIVGGR